MKLSSQKLPELDDVTEADIERIFGGEEFGKFALLGDRDGDFIEVGHKGQPAPWAFDYPPGTLERRIAEEWRAFKERTGSEWWKVDYFDVASGEQYEAEGDLTLAEVKRVFVEYLRGDETWKSRYRWIKLEGCGDRASSG
jgi:hypothetical protein